MALGEIRRHTIAMYNEMISYYKANIDKISKYGRTIITKELIDKMEERRSKLSKGYKERWER